MGNAGPSRAPHANSITRCPSDVNNRYHDNIVILPGSGSGSTARGLPSLRSSETGDGLAAKRRKGSKRPGFEFRTRQPGFTRHAAACKVSDRSLNYNLMHGGIQNNAWHLVAIRVSGSASPEALGNRGGLAAKKTQGIEAARFWLSPRRCEFTRHEAACESSDRSLIYNLMSGLLKIMPVMNGTRLRVEAVTFVWLSHPNDLFMLGAAHRWERRHFVGSGRASSVYRKEMWLP